MRIFKSEVKELNNDDQVTAAAEPRQIEQSQPQQAPHSQTDTQHNTSA